MSVPLLVAALVRQTTVLIAQVATSGGVRAPLAQVADQVFRDLVRELERQGVSRKVTADMFGMGLRSFLRRLQRLGESSTEHGRSLWEAVLEFLRDNAVVTRARVLERFCRDEELQVKGVLFDLTQSGLAFVSGAGSDLVYRAATDDELSTMRQTRHGEGLEELVWVLVFRQGPVSRDELFALGGVAAAELDHALLRLVEDRRISIDATGPSPRYLASSFVVPCGATVGFEAAVFDHFQAMVQTFCCRLRGETPELTVDGLGPEETVGGSTYSFDLWPGHPHATEVLETLSKSRERLTALRAKVEQYNAQVGLPPRFEQVTCYAGQCCISQEPEGRDA
jgi:hypothetical protein